MLWNFPTTAKRNKEKEKTPSSETNGFSNDEL